MKPGHRGALALVLNGSIEGMSEEEVVESLTAQLDTLSEVQRMSFDRTLQPIGETVQRALLHVVQGAATSGFSKPFDGNLL
jgi:hypothetical protein